MSIASCDGIRNIAAQVDLRPKDVDKGEIRGACFISILGHGGKDINVQRLFSIHTQEGAYT